MNILMYRRLVSHYEQLHGYNNPGHPRHATSNRVVTHLDTIHDLLATDPSLFDRLTFRQLVEEVNRATSSALHSLRRLDDSIEELHIPIPVSYALDDSDIERLRKRFDKLKVSTSERRLCKAYAKGDVTKRQINLSRLVRRVKTRNGL